MSDDREKRSWKDIDQARIRGQKFEKTASKGEVRAQKLASNDAKKQLNQLFSSSKLSKAKTERVKAIQSARGTSAFYEKLNDYYKEFGLSLDWDVVVLFLDHRDKKLVLETLNQLLQLAPKETLARQDLLGAKLKVMLLGTFDPEISSKITELQKAILRA